jgi:hypothetical protein
MSVKGVFSIHTEKELRMPITTSLSDAMRSVSDNVLHPLSSKSSYTLQKEVKVVKRSENGRVTHEMQWQLRDSGFDMGQGTYRRIPNDFFVPESHQTTASASRSGHSLRSDSIREQIREVLARGRKEPAEVLQEKPDDATTASKKEVAPLELLL